MSATDETRLLIATGEAAANVDELPPLIRTLIQSASEILVITPILVSRLRWLASDTDRARYEADERLGVVLGHIDALAPEAETRVESVTRLRSRRSRTRSARSGRITSSSLFGAPTTMRGRSEA